MSSALDDYDEATKKCKACGMMVLKRTNDQTQKSYMINGDESYHQVYAGGNKICVKDKAEMDYAKEHGSLEGFKVSPPKSPDAPPTSGPKEPDTVPKEVLLNAVWWENNWPQAVRVATNTVKVNANTDQNRIVAMAIMHDFSSLEVARSLKKAMGVK